MLVTHHIAIEYAAMKDKKAPILAKFQTLHKQIFLSTLFPPILFPLSSNKRAAVDRVGIH